MFMILGICTAIIATIFFSDLCIKNHIESKLPEGKTIVKCRGKILIRKHHNRGAMLNIGQGKREVIAALSVVLTIVSAIAFIFSLGRHGSNMLRIGLAFLLGGAFSNTYDRVKRKHVVDYLSFGVKWKWFGNVVFNISDFCIMIGALMSALAAGR